MCGIFGLVQKEKDNNTKKIFRDLFLLSESRGKEASGFAINSNDQIRIFKTPFPASAMVKNVVFNNEFFKSVNDSVSSFIGIGHSRLVTNGYEQFDENNQPVVKNGIVAIHNGIIVNQSELWVKYQDVKRISELDSELIPTIISYELIKGNDLGKAIGRLFGEISGMTNIALLSDTYNNLVLATNNGSIYYIHEPQNGLFIFASEKYIINQLLRKHKPIRCDSSIEQIKPGELINVNLNNLSIQSTRIGERLSEIEGNKNKTGIIYLKDETETRSIYVNTSLNHKVNNVEAEFLDVYLRRKTLINGLKRCTKCTLPETFPFIKFDEKGVCNYCNTYHKIEYQGKEALVRSVDSYHKKKDEPECLIPFSGGRDSSYALHFAVKELGLKPIAFSYDWGMLTDLARRNQSRMCGKLGIEHILVSADIRKKRENIRKNVSAWLKKPDLGTIPLFMAGDKQYFYYSKLLQKQNGLDLVIMGENHLEKTLFKSAFSGARQDLKGYMAYHISGINKTRMLGYYLGQYLKNPAFLNSSLLDTAGAFLSYYTIKHDYLNLYNFIKWDERIITDTLINGYNWETDPGTLTTWRIGDGTAAFYNYIYYMVAGFSENDTFRSNQIREGDLTREKALELSIIENQPRWDSIQWYCRTIAIDFENTIRTINKIRTLYGKK